MSSTQILSTFQSTFPGLYQTQSKSDEAAPGKSDAESSPREQFPESGSDPYNARIAGITSKFERMRASADEMEQYLRTAAEEAKEAEARALAKADEEFTPAWRSVGLPLKPSHLQLDHGAMSGARLVNPKAIVQEYQAIKGREVLNPPRIAEYADTSAKPNYLKETHANEVRKTRTLSPERLTRVQQISSKALTWHTLTADEVAAKIAESEERRRQQSLKMPRAQFEKEQKIIQAMHQKLTFLRNPRHPLPPAVKTLLDLRPEPRRWAGPRAELRHGVTPPIKANMTAHQDAIFVIEPAEVTFTDYAVGRTYEKLLRVRNVTAVSRGLRVFPPASQYFHVSLPRFPMDTDVLAPGMAAELTLRFCPDSLGDYEDAISVDTHGLRLTVPLRAQRPPPSLTLPEEFDMGQVVIGNIKMEQISFKNLGGPGRFRIVPEADWPDFAHDAPTDRAVVGPFKIWPLCFEMASNDEIAINVSYEPIEWGNNEERLVLVCDNCQVKTFSLLGNGVSVDVLLHSVDGRMLEPRELDLPLWFGEVAPRSGFSKTVSVRNTTKLPFAFEWAFTRHPQVQHKRRANEPLQTEQQYDEEQDDDGHVLLVDNKSLRGSPHSRGRGASEAGRSGGGGAGPAAEPSAPAFGSQSVSSRPMLLPGAEQAGTPWGIISGSGAHGPDTLALGAVVESVFSVVPERGVLQPGEVMEFLFTFTPPACQRYERWAQLRVDRTPIPVPPGGSGMLRSSGTGSGTSHAALAAAATCDVLVAEVGLEGLGCLVELAAVPRLVSVQGSLMPRQRTVRTVELRNPTRGPVDVRAAVDNPALSISPPVLNVPGLGTASLEVAITAPDQPGPLRGRVVLHVDRGHGPPVPLEVRAHVGTGRASFKASRLDFGLVRLSGTAEKPLVIRNRSATSATHWSVRELTPAVVAAEKSRLLRRQLMQSSRMLDPVAAAAALEALEQEEGQEEEQQPLRGPEGEQETELQGGGDRSALLPRRSSGTSEAAVVHAAAAAAAAAAAERRAAFAEGHAIAKSDSAVQMPQPQPLPAHSTYLTFEPSSGVLGPGQELTVRVRCHARADGRSRSLIQLLSGAGGEHMECIEAFVCVVTPQCALDRPVLDLGVTFVGVQVRQLLTMRNLSLLPLEYKWSNESADDAEGGALADLKVKPDKGQLAPGEEVELQVRYTPRAVGPSVMYGVCELDGAPLPLGFRISSNIQGLDVTYDLLTQEEYDEMGSPSVATAAAPPPLAAALATEPSAFSSFNAAASDAVAAAKPTPVVSYIRRGRSARPELNIEGLQGLPNLPPDILARVASGRSASTTADGTGRDRHSSGRSHRRSGQGVPLAASAGPDATSAAAVSWPPPTPYRHLVADFGRTVPLGETRQMYLVITNRTAMHTSVRTWLDRFGVEDASKFSKGLKTSGFRAGDSPGQARRDSTLSVAESDATKDAPKIRASKYTPIKLTGEAEKRAPFRAAKGNEMMAARRLQEEAEQALGNKGLAVSVAPPETTLAPWSRKVLAISCFNDMCGAYMDMLHVKVGDLPTKDIPVLVGVAGTPLVVQRERVLVKGLRERSWRTALAWGHVPLGVEQKRTFYVFNTGSLDMHLCWQMLRFREYIDLDQYPPTTDVGAGGTGLRDSLYSGPGRLRDTRAQFKLFDVKLTPDERRGVVRVTATRHADPDDAPFVVEPREAVLRGGANASFTVTFTSAIARTHAGYLHGTCKVHSDDAGPGDSANGGDGAPAIQLRVWPTGEAGEGLGAMLSGTFHPYAGAPPTPLQPLRVDLSAATLAAKLEPDGLADLSWTVASIHQPTNHPSFVRSVTLSNTQACPQIFSLDVEGPWDLVAATPSVPQEPVAFKGTSTLLAPAAATGRLGASPTEGGQVFLPPRESVDITLRYAPGKGDLEALPVRFAAMQARQRVIETTTDYKNTGALTVTFANGDKQSLPLVAEMLHPRLQVRPRKLNFGKVHLQSPKELVVELSNPTTVDAAWAVTVEGVKPRFPTLPGAGAQATAAAAASGTGASVTETGSASAGATPRSSSGAEGANAGQRQQQQQPLVSASASVSVPRVGTVERLGSATGGVPPPPPLKQSVPSAPLGVTGIIAEARIGPYVVRPASGVLPGRGLRMPHTQQVSILFAPTEAESFDGELIFAVLRGKECSVEIDGVGSVEETDEHKGRLFVI